MQSFQFHPTLARWFAENFGSPTEPQKRGWPSIQSGDHTLIAAPTGSGKTLAAFLAALDHLFREGLEGKLQDQTSVVYVSPLKALSNDIHKNLEEPLAEIGKALALSEGRHIELRAQVRTGDTPAAKRQAMIRKPPHILVTTPESLYLLLTSGSGRKLLSNVRTLIVDEIHAVVSNRRSSHLALSMERLSALVPHPLQRIGLSATQKPIEEVARFLVGNGGRNSERSDSAQRELNSSGNGTATKAPQAPPCTIIDCGYSRAMDVSIEVPGSALEAVMSNEVWTEVYSRLVELIEEHRTTLVFVNTRRMAERVTHQLGERLGKDKVTSHHGSLSAPLRLDAENRLKRGDLKALVATASLELGIDIGSVDLVCQLGPTRSIATFLQRVGRARHQREGLPKGRLFPLSRDELVECTAMLRSVRRGELDHLVIPQKPLDVLAQQLVACTAVEDWDEDDLFHIVRRAWPYRNLEREEYDQIVQMLAEGFSTKRGRRAALIHHDAVNHRLRARRGARLVALTSGGAIPETGDYRVVLEPSETFIGTVNEDFAVESLAGDIFQLGNASWRILRVNPGVVRVEDAQGQPPNMPFWLGEAPSRTAELSRSVSDLRTDIETQIRLCLQTGNGNAPPRLQVSQAQERLARWLEHENVLPEAAARQLADYFVAIYQALGVIPSQDKLVLERFFDESGGMQLVLHSPFGSAINRAWGLALRKRFCRSFNFELQAAATDEAIVLSLGTQHSFPLEEVFRYLHSNSIRQLLIQALLDAPMFPIRWRWNATRALALPRQRGGRKIPAPLQRMESENLLAAVFPDQLACLENIVGDRQVPDHPLVHQTIEDCLTEAMDIEGLLRILKRLENKEIACFAFDLPEPSPLAHEILNARPYAFLDNAPLEERRTQAVYTRRTRESSSGEGLGILDASAIQKVTEEAWPHAGSADELHEALMLAGVMTEAEMERTLANSAGKHLSSGPEHSARTWLAALVESNRVGFVRIEPSVPGRAFWTTAERLQTVQAVYPKATADSPLFVAVSRQSSDREQPEALRELVRSRLEVSGPLTLGDLYRLLCLPRPQIEAALLALEAEGFLLRGKFRPDVDEVEWCDRRLLARIHRLTLSRLRAEIQPVSLAEFQRFLLVWQRVEPDHQASGPEGLESVLESLDGYQLPAAAWEPEVLALRVKDYTPEWLDRLCLTGRVGWGRLAPPQNPKGRPSVPIRSSPVSLYLRDNRRTWLSLSPQPPLPELAPDTARVLEVLSRDGAQFFSELARVCGLLPSRIEQALAELVGQGLVTSDSFEGLRALLLPQEKRLPLAGGERRSRFKAVTSVEYAGRWSLLRTPRQSSGTPETPSEAIQHNHMIESRESAVERFARTLLRRYGVMFRYLIEREALDVSWYELGRVYRRLEAQGEIRGGHFVSGVSGEQFALPEAIGLMRSVRKKTQTSQWAVLCGADPLNLSGILTPGRRVAALTSNRLLLRDGAPLATLEAGEIVPLQELSPELHRLAERTLRVGTMGAPLRRYYA